MIPSAFAAAGAVVGADAWAAGALVGAAAGAVVGAAGAVVAAAGGAVVGFGGAGAAVGDAVCAGAQAASRDEAAAVAAVPSVKRSSARRDTCIIVPILVVRALSTRVGTPASACKPARGGRFQPATPSGGIAPR